jgi:AraC-like DNA-binding protein
MTEKMEKIPGKKRSTAKRIRQKRKTFDLPGIWYSWVFAAHELTDLFILPEPVQIFVIRGKITLHVDNRNNQTVICNEMLVLTGATYFRIESIEPAHVVICKVPVNVMFSSKLVEELTSINVPESMDSSKVKIHGTIRKFLLLLVHCLNGVPISKYWCDLKRQELFMLLFAYYDKIVLAGFFNQQMAQDTAFKMFVFNNYRKAKNIRELVALSDYSVSGFIKKFQRNFNESPYHWMQKQKAKLILTDINEGEKSLKTIAKEHNFSSYQHFSIFCRKNFDMLSTSILGKKFIGKYAL